MTEAAHADEMTREVVFVQALLNEGDGAGLLVVEAGYKRLAVERLHALTLRLRGASAAFIGSSMMM